jgi:hypothetical protein
MKCYSALKKGDIAICSNMNDFGRHYKGDTERKILHCQAQWQVSITPATKKADIGRSWLRLT